MENQNVSFLLPTYNGEETLKQCVKSLLSQKFNGKKEIIIVDDGSTDNSYEIALKLASKFEEIKLIKNEKNMGIVSSLNKAIKDSKYENIVKVNPDYIFEDENWTRNMLDAINSNKNVAACETYLSIPRYMLKQYDTFNKLNVLYYFRHKNSIATQNMFKKKALLEIGCYDKTFKIAGEDMDVERKLLKKGYKTIPASKTNTKILHLHSARNPNLKYLLISKAFTNGGEAAGVVFRKHFFLENNLWNPITSTILYGGLLIPYFRILSISLLILMFSYYTFLVATKIKDLKATIIAPFFKIIRDLVVIAGFWKGFLTGKQTFKE